MRVQGSVIISCTVIDSATGRAGALLAERGQHCMPCPADVLLVSDACTLLLPAGWARPVKVHMLRKLAAVLPAKWLSKCRSVTFAPASQRDCCWAAAVGMADYSLSNFTTSCYTGPTVPDDPGGPDGASGGSPSGASSRSSDSSPGWVWAVVGSAVGALALAAAATLLVRQQRRRQKKLLVDKADAAPTERDSSPHSNASGASSRLKEWRMVAVEDASAPPERSSRDSMEAELGAAMWHNRCVFGGVAGSACMPDMLPAAGPSSAWRSH